MYVCLHLAVYLYTYTVYCMSVYIDFHLAIQPIVEEKVVGHPDTMRLHRVALTVVVVAYVTCRVGRRGGGGEGRREGRRREREGRGRGRRGRWGRGRWGERVMEVR